jgi:hypothetical protein
MIFSPKTLEILKNFSTINQSIQFKPGNVLRTMSPIKTVLAEAQIDETIPATFAIYDLNKLLSKLAVYGTPFIEVTQDRILLKSEDGRRQDFIKFCDPSVIITPPEKQLKIGTPDVSFDLALTDLIWQRKSGSISGAPHLVFDFSDDGIWMISTEVGDNSFDITKTQISNEDPGVKFRSIIKVENFKVIDDDYTVQINKNGFAKLTGKTKGVSYFISIESEK